MTFAGPAHAVTNACTIGEFGNVSGGTSQLKVACTLTTAVGSTSTFYKTEDFPEAVWHTGAARQITTTAAVSGKTITASAGHFSLADINHGISGTGIPGNSFIVAITATTATLNNTPTTPSGSKLLVDNSDGRSVSDATFSGTTMTSASAHFCKVGMSGCGATQTDVGRVVSGTRLAHLTKITAVNSATSVTLSSAAAACPTGVSASNCANVSIASPATLTGARQVDDVSCSSATITSPAQAQFAQSDVGLPVTGTGVPAGDYIKTVTNATTATLNAATSGCTAGGKEVLRIGLSDAGAPANGSPFVQLGSELTVNPTLVAGAPACSANAPQAANLLGLWENPGSFVTASVLGSSTDASIKGAVLAQILFPTNAGINFAAYVVQVKASTAGETDTAAHVDIVYPLLPTGIAVCPAPSAVGIATTFQYDGMSSNQQSLPSGTPGNTDIRALRDDVATTKTTTAYVHIKTSATAASDAFSASGTCAQQWPDTVDFGCGNG